EWAQQLGLEPVLLGADLAGLDAIDTLVLEDTREIAKLESFVRRGGSIIVAVTPWGWLQLHPGKELATDLPINRLLAKAGVAFADGGAHGIR
ncbi:hypothetical protein C1X58_30150, partial [Pseudomonas sp. FW215-R4]|uniref:hypothetical protein n=1 Tax=Pseudomonas sp. FW215-R4 TaxID=2070616 RepID=UPI000CBFE090